MMAGLSVTVLRLRGGQRHNIMGCGEKPVPVWEAHLEGDRGHRCHLIDLHDRMAVSRKGRMITGRPGLEHAEPLLVMTEDARETGCHLDLDAVVQDDDMAFQVHAVHKVPRPLGGVDLSDDVASARTATAME